MHCTYSYSPIGERVVLFTLTPARQVTHSDNESRYKVTADEIKHAKKRLFRGQRIEVLSVESFT